MKPKWKMTKMKNTTIRTIHIMQCLGSTKMIGPWVFWSVSIGLQSVPFQHAKSTPKPWKKESFYDDFAFQEEKYNNLNGWMVLPPCTKQRRKQLANLLPPWSLTASLPVKRFQAPFFRGENSLLNFRDVKMIDRLKPSKKAESSRQNLSKLYKLLRFDWYPGMIWTNYHGNPRFLHF